MPEIVFDGRKITVDPGTNLIEAGLRAGVPVPVFCYHEYAGGDDFGATASRNPVYFGRFTEGPLESPYSGNLVELCPTGVFTDKLFRYKSRVWDLEIRPSICPHCSVGCNVLPGSRHRELQRVRVNEN